MVSSPARASARTMNPHDEQGELRGGQVLDVRWVVVGGDRQQGAHPVFGLDGVRVVELVPFVRELVADAEGAVPAERRSSSCHPLAVMGAGWPTPGTRW